MKDIIKLFENIPGLSITKNGSVFVFQVGGQAHQHNDFMNGVKSVLNKECNKVNIQIEQMEDDLLKLRARLEVLSEMEQSIKSQWERSIVKDLSNLD